MPWRKCTDVSSRVINPSLRDMVFLRPFFLWCRLRGIDRPVTNGRVWCLAIWSCSMDSWSLKMTVRSCNVPYLALLAGSRASPTSIMYRSLHVCYTKNSQARAPIVNHPSFKATMKLKNSLRRKKKYWLSGALIRLP